MSDVIELKAPTGEVHIIFEGRLNTETLINLVKRYGDNNKELIIAELEKYIMKGTC